MIKLILSSFFSVSLLLQINAQAIKALQKASDK